MHMAAQCPLDHWEVRLRAGKEVGAWSNACAVGHTTSAFSCRPSDWSQWELSTEEPAQNILAAPLLWRFMPVFGVREACIHGQVTYGQVAESSYGKDYAGSLFTVHRTLVSRQRNPLYAVILQLRRKSQEKDLHDEKRAMQGEAWGEEAVCTAPAHAHVGLPGLSLPSPYTLPCNMHDMMVPPRFPAVVQISTWPC